MRNRRAATPPGAPDPLPPYLAPAGADCVLALRVVPRAGRTALAGERGGSLHVRLAAAPVEGAANAELVTYLSALLDVPRRALSIVSGEHARDKRVRVAGLAAGEVAARLRTVGRTLG